MNIMKTNMLLLDNKIRKDDTENTAPIAAPVPSADQPQAGMKALMFQGMQNLMANPQLAKEVGVMNENSNSAISFQGGFKEKVTNKMVQGFLPAVMAVSTLLPGALSLASCDKTEINISIDLEAVTEAMNALRAEMREYQATQNQNNAAILEALNKAYDALVEIKAAIVAETLTMQDFRDMVYGELENGKYQMTAIIDAIMTLQGITEDAARNIVNTILTAYENGEITFNEAMAQITAQLKKVNENLGTIIDNQDKAYQQRNEAIAELKAIKTNTAETRDAVVRADSSLNAFHRTYIEGNNAVLTSLKDFRNDVNADFDKVAKILNWSTSELLAYMKKMNIDINNTMKWNASMIYAAISYNNQLQQKQLEEQTKLRQDFNSYRLEAKEYAEKLIAVEEDTNMKLGILSNNFNNYAKNMQNYAKTAIAEIRTGNKTTAEIKDLVTNVYAEQQKAYAMYEIMNQNIENIDVDMNANHEELVNTLKWLGYTEAQIATMNTAAMINAIKSAANKTIFTIGGKLETVIDELETGNANGEQAIEILTEIAGDVSEIKDMLAEHFAKYDQDIAQLKSIAYGIKKEQEATRKDVEKLGYAAYSAAYDLKALNAQLADVRNKLKNGVQIDYNKLEEMFKRINANQQMSAAQIIARLDVVITQNEREAKKLDNMNKNLAALSYIVSNDVIDAINNIGDNLEGIDAINAKLDELIAIAKSAANSIKRYAGEALNAYNQEIALLKGLKDGINDIKKNTQTQINQAKKAEIQRQNIELAINSIGNSVTNIENKLGRSLTAAELDSILAKHEVSLGDLIIKANLKNVDLSKVENELGAIKASLSTYQAQAISLYIDILNKIKDYSGDLTEIKELLKGFKFECNCQADVEHNQEVHEGIIRIIG